MIHCKNHFLCVLVLIINLKKQNISLRNNRNKYFIVLNVQYRLQVKEKMYKTLVNWLFDHKNLKYYPFNQAQQIRIDYLTFLMHIIKKENSAIF